MDFWHNLAYKYIPIKLEIIKESNIIKKKLFVNSINILGVLIRGTDYITSKPKKHCIPPTLKVAIRDIKKMNVKYKYDLIFLTTEDEIIRSKFINEFGDKLRFLKPKKSIKYNYKKKLWLAFNKNVNGNLYFMKIYLINIIILSNCNDILCARTDGSVGAFILSDGFRNNKVYFLGRYK